METSQLPEDSPQRPEEQAMVQLAEQVAEVLHPHYAPAADPAEATDMLNTAEVHHLVEDHAPTLLPLVSVREVLMRLNYRQHQIGDELRWLLKRA